MTGKENKEKHILVTGGTGFLGSYLLRYLVRSGYSNIRAVRRQESDLSLVAGIADRVDWLEGDILDVPFLEDAMAGVAEVYHCAAIVSFDPRRRRQMMAVNVEGTANVVNAALYQGVEKLVHVSSVAALGRTKQQRVIDERSNWVRHKYNSNYAISKYLSEQEVWRGMAEGLKVAVVNPSVILGSGRWDEGPLQLFKLAWRGFPFYTPGATGFVDVRDVARFMVRLMESDQVNERFILNAENMPFRELQKTLALELGKRPPYIATSRVFQSLFWRWEWLRTYLFGSSPLITRETAAAARRSFSFLNDKSKTTLGFEYTPIRQTISEAGRQFVEAAASGFEPRVLPLV